MFWICGVILASVHLASAGAIPAADRVATGPVEQSLKSKSWERTGDRHHEWQFPQYTECGKKDTSGQSGYDADMLIKGIGAAPERFRIPGAPHLCEWDVKCYRSVFSPYADKSITRTMEFKVKDVVKGVGQMIQFHNLYIDYGVHRTFCSSPKNNLKWWRIITGNDNHEDHRFPIDAPRDLS